MCAADKTQPKDVARDSPLSHGVGVRRYVCQMAHSNKRYQEKKRDERWRAQRISRVHRFKCLSK